jgi:hypothetical protein
MSGNQNSMHWDQTVNCITGIVFIVIFCCQNCSNILFSHQLQDRW